MSPDDTRMGKPSAWASNEPVVAPPVIHHHPLSPAVRVILVIYGLGLALSFGGVLWIVIAGQHQDAHDRTAIVAKVENDIEKARKAGIARDAANNAKMMGTVCDVIRESLNPTDNTRKLSRELGCGTLPSASPTPAPVPSPRATVYIYRSAPPASSRSTQRSSPPPRASRSPSARPSASPTCLLPKPLPCTSP